MTDAYAEGFTAAKKACLRIAEERMRNALGMMEAFATIGEQSDFFLGKRNAASQIKSAIMELKPKPGGGGGE